MTTRTRITNAVAAIRTPNPSFSWPFAGSCAHAPPIRLDPLENQVGDEVDGERHEEEEEGDDEQGVEVGAPLHRLAEFDGDGGGHGPHRIEIAVRHGRRVAAGHEHGHGFADGPAHAEHDRRDDAGQGRRQA